MKLRTVHERKHRACNNIQFINIRPHFILPAQINKLENPKIVLCASYYSKEAVPRKISHRVKYITNFRKNTKYNYPPC